MTEPFYRFFAIDYFATGEGRSFWLKICRNYPPYKSIADTIIDHDLERFIKFVDCDHYMQCFEELKEEEFMERYAHMIPEHVKVMLKRRDQPAFTWEVHYHFNYS